MNGFTANLRGRATETSWPDVSDRNCKPSKAQPECLKRGFHLICKPHERLQSTLQKVALAMRKAISCYCFDTYAPLDEAEVESAPLYSWALPAPLNGVDLQSCMRCTMSAHA